MAHAEKCPVCGGSGVIVDSEFGRSTAAQATKPCHGCGGSGWVTVHDCGKTNPVYVPYYVPYVPYVPYPAPYYPRWDYTTTSVTYGTGTDPNSGAAC